MLTVHNSILWNDEEQNVNEIPLDDLDSDSMIATYSDIKGGWVGVGTSTLTLSLKMLRMVT